MIETIEAKLEAIEHIRTPDHDEHLEAIEALAGPYALAFLYEIRWLEKPLRRYEAS